MNSYYAYILTNHTRMLYVGMTDDIRRRTFEHKTGYFEASFTDRYRMGMLVYFEEVPDALSAALREKQLKGWSRQKKIALLEKKNPRWIDLSDRWFTEKELESGIMLPLEQKDSLTSASLLPDEGSATSRLDPSTTAGTPSLRI